MRSRRRSESHRRGSETQIPSYAGLSVTIRADSMSVWSCSDECQEDVEARMTTIYESEATYQDDLNGFLDAEVAYIDRYREALMEAKNAVGGSYVQPPPSLWAVCPSMLTSPSLPPPSRSLAPSRPSLPQRRSLIPPPANDRRRSSPSSDPEPLAPPPSSSSFLGSRARSNSTKSGDGKDPTAAAAQKEKKSLFGSLGRKKSGLTPKRGATSSWGALDEDGDGARDGMVNGRGGSSEEDEDERPRSSGGNRNRSFSSATVVQSGSGGEFGGGGGRAAPGFPRRNTLGATSSSQGKKVVKSVLSDHSSSPPACPILPTDMPLSSFLAIRRSTFAYLATAPDELSFSPGELITVLSEVSPDWWTGTSSTTGSSGLFPAAYTEPAPQQQQHSNTPPPLPSAMRPTAGAQRSHSSNDLLGGAGGGGARRVLPPPPAGPVRQNSFLTDSESNATSASEAESEDDEGEKAGLTGLAPPSSSGGGRARGMSGSLGLGGLVGNGGAKKGLAPPPPVPRSRRSTVSSRGDEGARGGGVSEGENPFH